MTRIRRFEDKCAELYTQEKIRGFLHLYDGEEAVGVIPLLGADDRIVGTPVAAGLGTHQPDRRSPSPPGSYCTYVSDVLSGAATGILAAALALLFYLEGLRLDGLLTRIC